MIDKQFLIQLQKAYEVFLRRIIRKEDFQPVRLRGGKRKPETTQALHQAIQGFLTYEKRGDQPGWNISWEHWQSRKLGKQRWPQDIIIETEQDLVFILKKQEEVSRFKQQLETLVAWNDKISGWLEAQPNRVLQYQPHWKDICAVLDFLLQQDCTAFYLRNLPIPVHTKFIEAHQSSILSLLRHFQPERFSIEINDLEKALGLRKKPLLYPIRWLDKSMAIQHTAGFDVLALAPSSLKGAGWMLKEIWLVENETNLYLLPDRQNALAICSMGYSLYELKDIPIFSRSSLIYWGDLDEDGFIMLGAFRHYYPHLQSVLMDHQTVLHHQKEIETINYRFGRPVEGLLEKENAAYLNLLGKKGRIEQEKLQQDFVQHYLSTFDRHTLG